MGELVTKKSDSGTNTYLLVPILIFFVLLIFAVIRGPNLISSAGIGSEGTNQVQSQPHHRTFAPAITKRYKMIAQLMPPINQSRATSENERGIELKSIDQSTIRRRTQGKKVKMPNKLWCVGAREFPELRKMARNSLTDTQKRQLNMRIRLSPTAP